MHFTDSQKTPANLAERHDDEMDDIIQKAQLNTLNQKVVDGEELTVDQKQLRSELSAIQQASLSQGCVLFISASVSFYIQTCYLLIFFELSHRIFLVHFILFYFKFLIISLP